MPVVKKAKPARKATKKAPAKRGVVKKAAKKKPLITTPYVGTKGIEARKMTLGAYNKYRGWQIPQNENPKAPGYLVVYPDGYQSWSPAEAFEAAYEKSGSMSYESALHLLKEGKRVARKGWNGKGMFIFLVPGSEFKVNRPPLQGIYKRGTPIKYHAHIDMRTATGDIVPWLASQTDMLANDWVVLK